MRLFLLPSKRDNTSNELSLSRASIYRYLEKGYLSTKPIDFPHIVKFRKRRTRNLQPIPKAAKEGRSYEDFQRFLTKEGISYWLEMDTVTGRIGGKLLLTFNLSFCNFIFARLLDNNTHLKSKIAIYHSKWIWSVLILLFFEKKTAT